MADSHFDLSRIRAQSRIAQIEYHASITSTNDRAKLCAQDVNCPLPLLVLADEQTAGRGRGAKRWWSSKGCLMFSAAYSSTTIGSGPNSSPARLGPGLLALATALAVTKALDTQVPNTGIGIHWPNDIFVAGKKLVGILIEVLPNRRPVIGIGVNVNNRFDEAPPDVRGRAISLRELTGHTHDCTGLLIDILKDLDTVMPRLHSATAEVIAEANARCLQQGKILKVESADHCLEGRCQGIGPDGELLLETADGLIKVVSVVRVVSDEW